MPSAKCQFYSANLSVIGCMNPASGLSLAADMADTIFTQPRLSYSSLSLSLSPPSLLGRVTTITPISLSLSLSFLTDCLLLYFCRCWTTPTTTATLAAISFTHEQILHRTEPLQLQRRRRNTRLFTRLETANTDQSTPSSARLLHAFLN